MVAVIGLERFRTGGRDQAATDFQAFPFFSSGKFQQRRIDRGSKTDLVPQRPRAIRERE